MTKSTRPRSCCKHCGSIRVSYRSRTYEYCCSLCGKITKKGQKGSVTIREHNKKGAAIKLKKMVIPT